MWSLANIHEYLSLACAWFIRVCLIANKYIANIPLFPF